MNGSVLAVVFEVVGVGSLLLVEGATALLGVVGVLFSFSGEVPVLDLGGVVVVVVVVLGVVFGVVGPPP